MKKAICIILALGALGLTGCKEDLGEKLKAEVKEGQSEAAMRMGGGKPQFNEIKFRDPFKAAESKTDAPKGAEEPKGK